MPRLLGVIFILTAIGAFVQARRAPSASAVVVPPVAWRPLLVTAGALACYFAAFETVGFVVSTSVYLIVQAWALGSRRLVRDVVASVVLAVVTDAMFRLALQIALPRGVWFA